MGGSEGGQGVKEDMWSGGYRRGSERGSRGKGVSWMRMDGVKWQREGVKRKGCDWIGSAGRGEGNVVCW